MRLLKWAASIEDARKWKVLFHKATDQRMTVVAAISAIDETMNLECGYMDSSGRYLHGRFAVTEFWFPRPSRRLVAEARFVLKKGGWADVDPLMLHTVLCEVAGEVVLGCGHSVSAGMLAHGLGMTHDNAYVGIERIVGRIESLPWETDKG